MKTLPPPIEMAWLTKSPNPPATEVDQDTALRLQVLDRVLKWFDTTDDITITTVLERAEQVWQWVKHGKLDDGEPE